MTFRGIQKFVKNRQWPVPLAFSAVFLIDLAYSFYRLMYLNAGGDSQWYGSKLFWEGVNPYAACLATPESEWFMTAFPNYAHLLYIALFPLSIFDWGTAKVIWFLFSVICFLFMLYLFIYKEKIPVYKVLLPATILLLGSPLTNTLYQAQISLVIMAFIAMAWIYRERSIVLVLLLSVIFTKYSFGLAILFGFFLAGYRKESIAAFGLNMFCALIFAFKFDIGFLETLMQPFEVASRYTEFGHSDLLSVFRTTNTGETIFGLNYYSIIAAIVYLVYTYLCLATKANKKAIVLSSLLLSLSIFFHLDYDYVAFLAIILIAMSKVQLSKNNLVLLISVAAYFWLYPIIPKLMRTFLHIDTGLIPVEWFGKTYGTIFILCNTILITVTAFRILLDKKLNASSRTKTK